MKYVLLLLLTGCAAGSLQEIGQGLSGAGQVMQTKPAPIPVGQAQSRQQVDHQCRSDCFSRGYSWAYCTKECSY
jgi:hypothetical protein